MDGGTVLIFVAPRPSEINAEQSPIDGGNAAKLRQLLKFSDVSDVQSPIDGGKAVMMTSEL